MAIAKMYGLSLKSLAAGEIDFLGGNMYAALTSNSYVPNQDTHDYFDDITNEVSGAGYTAGGVLLTAKTSVYTTGTNTLTLDAADPSWATVSIPEIRYVIFYLDSGSDSTSPLLSYMDLEANYAPSAQSFTVTLASTGIATYTAA
jgi:hypothetical protein